jgi:hypothetical protein
MINIQEVLHVLQINGLNKDSSFESVNNIFTQLKYHESDKQNVIQTLKSQGWFSVVQGVISQTKDLGSTPTLQIPSISKRSNKLLVVSLVIISLIIIGGGVYLYLNRTNVDSIKVDTNVASQIDDNLTIKYISVPATENSINIFNSVRASTISKEDRDFFTKYFDNKYSATNTPPLEESRKIVSKYQNVLKIFEAGTDKKYYQCSLVNGDVCNVGTIKNIAAIATLNSFVLFKDGKITEAKDYVSRVIKLGQMLTSQSDELIVSLIGWVIQREGYQLELIEGKSGIPAGEKTKLISDLRNEHKNVLKYWYTRRIEAVDYVTDISKKPSGVIDEDSEDIFNLYRKDANNITWKPDIVKNWFKDSLKISLANIDLPCGSKFKDSLIDIGFKPEDTSQQENYVGKMFYTQGYISLASASPNRCEVEILITSL